MIFCCECCVLSGRALCHELSTRPEESYRLWCVVMCGLGTSRMKRPWPALGSSVTGKKKYAHILTIEVKLVLFFCKGQHCRKSTWSMQNVENNNDL
jgi:hypothetical protein